jgi:catechol 2,3-dioxygenase-like lactoylglutathione lyase family enzyme
MMPDFEFHHVSLLTGQRELARQCEKYYCDMLGLRVVKPASESAMEDFAFLTDQSLVGRAPLEIIGDIYEERERVFLEKHGPGLDHICFTTDDLDLAYESLSAAGVDFHIPPYTFQNVRLAWCRDPIGTEVEISQYVHKVAPKLEGPQPHPVNGRISHVGILIDGAELARETEKFYTDHFGVREIMRGDPNQEGMNWVYLEDASGSNPFWLEVVGDVFFDEEKAFLEKHGPSMDHLCFLIDDSQAAYSWLKEQEVKIEIEPLDYGNLRMFYVRDPAGVMIQLIQMLDQ